MGAVFFAAALDLALGDPAWLWHPVRLFGWLITKYEALARRLSEHPLYLRFAGGVMAAFLVLFAYGGTYFLIQAVSHVSRFFGGFVEGILMWNCLALRCLCSEVMKIYYALSQGDTEKARTLVSYLVSRDTAALSETGIVRAAVETAAENASDGVLAPLFFLCIGGAPLGMAYKAVNTMDSMVGYQNERYFDFGFVPAKLDDLVNWIPARLTAFFLLLPALFFRHDFFGGLRVALRDHKKSKSPNAGWPEAAVAGCLHITLGGPTPYFGKMIEKPVIGAGGREVEKEDIRTVVCYLYLAAGFALLAFLLGSVII